MNVAELTVPILLVEYKYRGERREGEERGEGEGRGRGARERGEGEEGRGGERRGEEGINLIQINVTCNGFASGITNDSRREEEEEGEEEVPFVDSLASVVEGLFRCRRGLFRFKFRAWIHVGSGGYVELRLKTEDL